MFEPGLSRSFLISVDASRGTELVTALKVSHIVQNNVSYQVISTGLKTGKVQGQGVFVVVVVIVVTA